MKDTRQEEDMDAQGLEPRTERKERKRVRARMDASFAGYGGEIIPRAFGVQLHFHQRHLKVQYDVILHHGQGQALVTTTPHLGGSKGSKAGKLEWVWIVTTNVAGGESRYRVRNPALYPTAYKLYGGISLL